MSFSIVPEYQKLCPWSIIGGQVCRGFCPYRHDEALLKVAWGLDPTATIASSQVAATTSNPVIATNNVVVTAKHASLCRDFTAGIGCKKKHGECCEMIHDFDFRKAVLNVEAIARKAEEGVDDLCNGYKSLKVCQFYSTGAPCYNGKNCCYIHDSSLRETAYEVIANSKDLLSIPKGRQVEKHSGPQKGTLNEQDEKGTLVGKPKADHTFRLPDLPGELRNKIWRAILHECPYTAWLRLHEIKDSDGIITGYKVVTKSKLPLLLYLCRESRAEALKHFSLSFGTRTSSPRVYFNFHTDTAYLHTRTIRDLEIFNSCLSRYDQRNLQNMILKVKDWAASGEEGFADFICQFVRVRRLLILVGRDKGDQVYIENPELPAVIRRELKGSGKGRRHWYPPQIYVEECPGLLGFDHQYDK